MPPFVKRVLMTSGLVAGVGVLFISRLDPSAGAAFAGAALWAIASLYVWGKLIPLVCVSPTDIDMPGRRTKLVLVALSKGLLFAVAVAALYMFGPETRAQLFAVIGGVSVPFIVMLLKAVGGQLTNRDILQEGSGKTSAAEPSAPGGEG